ncbi:MAG: hypothetical protein M9883_08240 [Methylobacteriaceae bacterium]|nr:hypothetical protein [Methylobacteriaceae bacterium]
MPDDVANRVGSALGSGLLSGAIHRVATGEYGTANLVMASLPRLCTTSPTRSASRCRAVKFNLPMLAPGDNQLQATYAKARLAATQRLELRLRERRLYCRPTTASASPASRRATAGTWSSTATCVWTYAGTCDKSTALAIIGVFTTIDLSLKSWVGASYYQVKYSDNAINPIPSAMAAGAAFFNAGLTNYREFDLLAGIAWNPIRGFEIGAEFDWMHGAVSRPVGLGNDAQLIGLGLPAFKSQADLFRGKLRMIRAF